MLAYSDYFDYSFPALHMDESLARGVLGIPGESTVVINGKRSSQVIWDRYYNGKLIKFDEETAWFRVKYEDGDIEEDLE
ncbi:hypothetical protein H5410_035690 [Solanum commersonii]|uniref:PTM/DIR17-like Tudor domain-containing protein n=1 Tax=Solanum commersonii TaxID=4109 RepID=A0A9J5Y3C3_SOLCO|nr:hypothetical protein H5410_035690 [Solanum commersonii]